MYKQDLEEYGDYVIFEHVKDETDSNKYTVHYICVCKEYKIAEMLCYMLAKEDKVNDPYYFTGITNPGDFIPGGGWYVSFQKDKDGKIRRSSLS